MRQGRSCGLRKQYGENRGDAFAASGSSFEKDFAISWAGVARGPMPRGRGRFFGSDGMSTSAKEGALDCGWGALVKEPL